MDFVRTRAGDAMLEDGFEGEAARERDVGAASAFALAGFRDEDGGGIRDIFFRSTCLSIWRRK